MPRCVCLRGITGVFLWPTVSIDVIRTGLDWQSRGQRVVMGTVMRTWGLAPRPPGSLMLISGDGQLAGTVSGVCIEDDLIARVGRGELALRRPQATAYGETADEARRFGLPCVGTVQLVLEPLSAASQLRGLLAAIKGHRRVQRWLDMATGVAKLGPTNAGDRVQFDGQTLITVHGPAPAPAPARHWWRSTLTLPGGHGGHVGDAGLSGDGLRAAHPIPRRLGADGGRDDIDHHV